LSKLFVITLQIWRTKKHKSTPQKVISRI